MLDDDLNRESWQFRRCPVGSWLLSPLPFFFFINLTYPSFWKLAWKIGLMERIAYLWIVKLILDVKSSGVVSFRSGECLLCRKKGEQEYLGHCSSPEQTLLVVSVCVFSLLSTWLILKGKHTMS